MSLIAQGAKRSEEKVGGDMEGNSAAGIHENYVRVVIMVNQPYLKKNQAIHTIVITVAALIHA